MRGGQRVKGKEQRGNGPGVRSRVAEGEAGMGKGQWTGGTEEGGRG